MPRAYDGDKFIRLGAHGQSTAIAAFEPANKALHLTSGAITGGVENDQIAVST